MATGGSLIGALRVTLGLDTAEFEAGTKRAKNIARREVSEIQKIMGGVKTAFAGLVTTASVAALASATKRALEYAGSLGEVAQQLGVTTRDLQLYRFVGGQVGVSQQEMDKGLQRLTRTMGEADAGAKKQATLFRELGISVRFANGDMKTAGDLVPQLADALSRIESPAARARIETQLFGKAGQQLDPLLSQGARGLAAFTDEAERLGVVLSPDLIARADDAADKIGALNQVLEARIAGAVADNAESIYSLADAFIALAGAAGDAIRTIRGWERIGKEEGLLSELGATGTEAFNAATPEGWSARKMGQWAAAQNRTAAYRRRSDASPQRLAELEREEQTAFAEWQSAGMDAFRANRPRTAPRGDGGLPTLSGGGGRTRRPRGRSGPSAEELAEKREALKLEHDIARAEAQGDEKRAKALRDQQALARSIKALEEAGLSKDEARTLAKQRQGELMWDQIAANIKAAKEAERIADTEFELQVARERGDEIEIKTLEREMWLAERIAFWMKNQKTEADATAKATAELAKLDEARAEANERTVKSLAEEHRLALMRARGDGDKADRIQWLDARTKEIAALAPKGGNDIQVSAEARQQALREAQELDRAYQQGYWRDTFKGAFRAAFDGDLGGWFENWWKEGVSNALEDVLNSLADEFANLLKSDGSGKGGIGNLIQGLAGLFGGGDGGGGMPASHEGGHLPGFASGGSFMVGGRPGIDKNILSINGIDKARVSANERVTVSPANDRGQPVMIQLGVRRGEMFEAYVEQTSRGAAVRVVDDRMTVAGMAGRHSLGRGRGR